MTIKNTSKTLLICILSFFFMCQVYPQGVKKSIILKEYKIKDSLFFSDLHSVIFTNLECLKKRENHILYLDYDSTNALKYNLIVTLISAEKKDSINNYGFFKIENRTCFISKTFPISMLQQIWEQTNSYKCFTYFKLPEYDEYGPLVAVELEDFSTWFFKYENNRLLLIEKWCIP